MVSELFTHQWRRRKPWGLQPRVPPPSRAKRGGFFTRGRHARENDRAGAISVQPRMNSNL